MNNFVPFKEEERAVLPGALNSDVKLVMIGVGKMNGIGTGDGKEIGKTLFFRKHAIILQYNDGTMHYDPEDKI